MGVGVGSRFIVVHIEKDIQVMTITITLLCETTNTQIIKVNLRSQPLIVVKA